MNRYFRMAAAFIITAAMFTACSSKNSSSSGTDETVTLPKNSISAEELSFGDTSPYAMESFRLNVSDELTASEGEDDSVIFIPKSNPIIIQAVEYTGSNLTSAANAEGICKEYEKKGQEAVWENYDVPGFDCAVIKTKTDAEEMPEFADYAAVNMYYVTIEHHTLLIAVGYAEGYEDIAAQYGDHLLSGLEYTGEYLLPTEPYTFENEFFSVNAQPKWFVSQNKETDIAKGSASVRFEYSHADSDYNYLTRYTIEADFSGDHSSAEEAAREFYDTNSQKENSTTVRRENYSIDEEELFGLPAWCVSFDMKMDDGLLNYSYTNRYVEDNGVIYIISSNIPLNDDGTAAADIQELIDGTTLKAPDESTLSSMRQEHTDSSNPEYRYKDAVFHMKSGMELKSDTDYDMTFGGYGADISISQHDLDDAPSLTYYTDLVYQELMDQSKGSYLTRDKFTVGDRKFDSVTFTGDEYDLFPGEIAKCCYTLYNDKIYEIRLVYNVDDEDAEAAGEEYLNSMLESLTFN